MYEVRENQKLLMDGTPITTYERDVISCNILEVEAGTTGYCGGDTGSGSRTYFRIKNVGGSDMSVRTIRHPYQQAADEFEVILGGDCELETMIRALKFIINVLEDESREVHD